MIEPARRYNITIKPSARKELQKLPANLKSRIHAAIIDLSYDPYKRGIRKLVQYEDIFRIRVGDYRILFRIDEKEHTIIILEIKNRKDSYR